MTTPVDAASPVLVSLVPRRDERSGDELVESVHRGHLVVARAGEVVAALGTPDVLTYLRSAAKPFQATACLEVLDERGMAPPAGSQIAVGWASHRGEPRHLAAVETLLARSGTAPGELTCPVAAPLADPAAGQARIHHNCSGKHAMFALAGQAIDCPRDELLDPRGRLQRRLLAVLAETLGEPDGVAVDGCGAPAVAGPLDRLALAYGQLAVDERFARVRQAAFDHPWLVGGEGRLESCLLAAGVVAKPGAEAVFAAGWRDRDGRGWGVAIKVEDGAARGATAAVHGLLAAARVVPVDIWEPPASLGGGRPVGRIRASDDVLALGRSLAA